MTVTAKLLKLYRVDQQIRGLRSRLTGAESYLEQQEKLLAKIEERRAALMSQVRQLEAQNHNDETEIKAADDRIAMLRERMNTARTSKEHSAYLTEINTIKADKALIEERELAALTKLDELRQQLAAVEAERDERLKVRKVAIGEREQRELEIRDRLAELEKERTEALKGVPESALKVYQERLLMGVEDVMAPIEEQNRRDMEYTCGACYTLLPIERVSILLKRGDITKCPSCQTILYLEETLRDDIAATQEKKSKKRVGVNGE